MHDDLIKPSPRCGYVQEVHGLTTQKLADGRAQHLPTTRTWVHVFKNETMHLAAVAVARVWRLASPLDLHLPALTCAIDHLARDIMECVHHG